MRELVVLFCNSDVVIRNEVDDDAEERVCGGGRGKGEELDGEERGADADRVLQGEGGGGCAGGDEGSEGEEVWLGVFVGHL